jgi:hypothetical protein
MSYIHVPTLPPILEEEEPSVDTRFPPKNSKRDRKRYRRHIRKQRKAYFKEATENKTWDTDTFLDKTWDWYFA